MKRYFIVPLLCALSIFLSSTVYSQTPELTVQFDNEELRPGDILTATVSVDTEIDFYFFSAEIIFSPDHLEFVQVENTGLSSGGLSIGDVITQGRVGVSVTRTSSLPSESSGDILVLQFEVKQFTPAGIESLSFDEVNLNSSDGSAIDFTQIAD
uniref:cohesin domain-containing protein n=1 Tax=Rhodohalobacter halophilus TaxID=1812810 RepID=UPI00114D257E